MQNGTGIQELMAAETRASQIVAEARIGESRTLFRGLCRVVSRPSSHVPTLSLSLAVSLSGRGDRMKQAKAVDDVLSDSVLKSYL